MPSSEPLARPEGRIPPQAVDVEKSVLGAMLTEREATPKVIELLDASTFYNPTHQKFFQAMVSLFDKGDPVDSVTLVEELRRRGQLNPTEDPLYITELSMAVTSAANVEYHARIVLEKALLRSLIAASTEVSARAYSDSEDALDLLDEAESKIFQISERRLQRTFTPIKQALHETFEKLQEIHGKHSGVTGVPSGFPQLDEKTGGFQNSDLVIIAGRPSQGKTALALSIARNAALHKEKKTGIGVFSLEMSEQQLIIRMLASEAKVNAHELRTGRLRDEEWKKLSRNVGRLAESKIFIDDTPALGILELRAKARRLKAEHGVGMVIVDYLQLVQGPRSAESREREISMISRSLKALAKELDIPVVALSQLNRAVETRGDKRPMLADLRECVTGETPVMLADGRRVPVRELVGQQAHVLTLTGVGTIRAGLCDTIWQVGPKPVLALTLASGRRIRATGNHRLLAPEGWTKVHRLACGGRLAVAPHIPSTAEPAEEEPGPGELSWDRIASIEHSRDELVYDLTVPGTAVWLADGIVSHNSGAIEQDADVVLFVHRPETYNIDTMKDDEQGSISSAGLAEIIIGKQRNGPTGMVRLQFHKEYAGFEKLESVLVPPPEVWHPEEEETPF
jgi:replicative DNA helicase